MPCQQWCVAAPMASDRVATINIRCNYRDRADVSFLKIFRDSPIRLPGLLCWRFRRPTRFFGEKSRSNCTRWRELIDASVNAERQPSVQFIFQRVCQASWFSRADSFFFFFLFPSVIDERRAEMISKTVFV